MPSRAKSDPIQLLAHSRCAFNTYCRPDAVPKGEILELGTFQCAHRHIKSGQALFRVGDELHAIYPVKAGSFKSFRMIQDDSEQVTGFYMCGEVIGLDAIATTKHTSTATALEDSVVCVIEYPVMEEQCGRSAGLQRRFHRLMSTELIGAQGLMLLLGLMTAEERVVTFLLGLSARFAALGYSATDFQPRMTHKDIASYLGLRVETVSRVLKSLHDRRVLFVDGKHIVIEDLPNLKRIGQRD